MNISKKINFVIDLRKLVVVNYWDEPAQSIDI